MKYVVIDEIEYSTLLEKIENVLQLQEEILSVKKKSMMLTNDEFIKLFDITKRTAQNWRNQGYIEYIKVGDKIYYPTDAIESFKARFRFKSFFSL